MLKGYKTFLLAALGVIVVILNTTGVLDGEVTLQILGIIGFGSIASLRAGIKKDA